MLPSIAHKGFRCGCTKGDQSSLPETRGYCQCSDKCHVNTSLGRESSSIQVLNLSSVLTHKVAWHVRLSKYSVILRQERREADVKSVLVAEGWDWVTWVNTSSENWKWQNSKWSYQGPWAHGLPIGNGGRSKKWYCLYLPLTYLGNGRGGSPLEFEVKYTCSDLTT